MLSVEEMKRKIIDYCQTTSCCNCPLDPDGICFIFATDEEIIANYNTLNNAGAFGKDNTQETKQDETQSNKHFKGYIFDSIVYRYQLARERQLMWEITKEKEDSETARRSYKRDVMRFIEILDEVIGEHD